MKKGLSLIARFHVYIIIVLILAGTKQALGSESLRYADLGDFRLESGAVINSCRLAYRIEGNMNDEKSKAILVPTWLAGTSKDFVDLGIVGAGRMIDSSRYCIISVDSFGNGLSSAPSNSLSQPGAIFPEFTIRDMVNAQHLLLTKHLGVNHLRAVIGFSMGGMQAFQWMISYPDFMDSIVSVAGTPWMTSNDLLVWTAEAELIGSVRKCINN